MNEYSEYTIELKLSAPLITPFQSDTIFGHICWAVRFLKWGEEDKLNDFLTQYETEDSPPLLISNGFPKVFYQNR